MEALSSRLSEGSALEAGNLRPVFALFYPFVYMQSFTYIDILN